MIVASLLLHCTKTSPNFFAYKITFNHGVNNIKTMVCVWLINMWYWPCFMTSPHSINQWIMKIFSFNTVCCTKISICTYYYSTITTITSTIKSICFTYPIFSFTSIFAFFLSSSVVKPLTLHVLRMYKINQMCIQSNTSAML